MIILLIFYYKLPLSMYVLKKNEIKSLNCANCKKNIYFLATYNIKFFVTRKSDTYLYLSIQESFIFATDNI